MRKISFRGRDKYGKWHIGDLAHNAEGITIKDYFVDEKTVGQFTGFTDHDETDIYEGDILKFEYGDTVYGVVEYVGGSFTVESTADIDCDSLEEFAWYFEPLIVGNIHDTPQYLRSNDNDN